MLKHYIILVVVLTCLSLGTYAQEPEGHILPYIMEGSEKWFLLSVPEATVTRKASRKQRKEYQNYYRMVYNLKKVYPYAQVAKNKLLEMNRQFVALKTEKERKTYIKKVEKEMMAEFEGPLRKLSRSQGKMLIKLVDRETGQSSFELVKELKGGFSAFFWQNIARLFGASLKTRYDKYGEDKLLEELVLMCEDGTFDSLYYSMFDK